MLNKEKYAKEIIELAINGKCIAVVNNSPCYCDIIPCSKCDFRYGSCAELLEQWANSEYKEKEIDWSKVPVDTPIVVWNCNNSNNDNDKYNRHFACFKYDKIFAWADGQTSHTAYNCIDWNYAEIAEGVDCSEWYKD